MSRQDWKLADDLLESADTRDLGEQVAYQNTCKKKEHKLPRECMSQTEEWSRSSRAGTHKLNHQQYSEVKRELAQEGPIES